MDFFVRFFFNVLTPVSWWFLFGTNATILTNFAQSTFGLLSLFALKKEKKEGPYVFFKKKLMIEFFLVKIFF